MAVLLGLDLGEKRVGVAVTDEAGCMAFPLKTISFRGRRHLLAELEKLIAEYQVEKIVVGFPKTLKGEVGPSAEKVMQQVDEFKRLIDKEWVFWDERLTTKESERILLEADISRLKRREVQDQLAAQRILQSYLESQKHR